jgi:DNA processing protein
LPPPFGEQKREKSLADQLAIIPGGLSGNERSVFRLLAPDSPTHIDSLVTSSKLSISDLTVALLTLEMRELIRALPGKCFVRKM